MIEDRLDRDERIRLECLNQAVTSTTMRPASAEQIIDKAKRFENYVRGVEDK